jgi:hypothetical protein
MADNNQPSASVGDRFPVLKQLEEDAERAKLEQALAEARAATVKASLPTADVERAKLDKEQAEAEAARMKALLPDLDVEVAKDTVTRSDKTSGLAPVLMQMDSEPIADDIAEVALDMARNKASDTKSFAYVFRVVTDPDVLGGVDVYHVLEGKRKDLETRLNEYVPADGGEPDGPEALAIPVLAISTAVSLGVQAIGLASKLFAKQYEIASREVAVNDIGFDLLLADNLMRGDLKSDETVEVKVDRIMPTPANSKTIQAIWQLAKTRDAKLYPTVVTNAKALAEAKAELKALEDELKARDAEILELTKRVPEKGEEGENDESVSGVVDFLREATKKRDELLGEVPRLHVALTDAQTKYERGTDLLTEIDEFVTIALTPDPNGGRAPAIVAARVEDIASSDSGGTNRYLLYARLVAGGLDQTVATKTGADHFRALAGLSGEYAMLDETTGELVAAGVKSVLQCTEMKLDDPDEFKQTHPGYTHSVRAEQTTSVP